MRDNLATLLAEASEVGRGRPRYVERALQVTPHFHSLVPDGVFVQREGSVHFEALPPPTKRPRRAATSRKPSYRTRPHAVA